VEARGPHLVLVPHTHWDREWYRTHEQFRFRLVSLIDDLLDLLERDPSFRHFMLDGQTIVLDDYLEVRPGARPRLEKLVREGRLAIGPWHVLPDEWLVSGEALIRNLRIGTRRAECFGGAMRLGYVPDQFGHVGQLPQLFAGFGFEAALLWRGVGADVDRTSFWWEAPDGTRLRTVYLRHGYGNAVNLPTEPAALAARLRGEIDSLRHSDVPVLLLMNGSDHERPDPELPRALDAALARLPGATLEIASLERYVALAAGAGGALPVHRGELRSGLRAPLLPGCASARAPQKRAEFRNDRLLTRYLEPLAAWLASLTGESDPERLDFAWRVALENHPHDSVCGCSIDAVHEQMDARYRRVEEIAGAHLEAVLGQLARRIALPVPGFGPGAGAPLAVWNPNAGGPAAVDADVELDVPLGSAGTPRPFHLRRADGTRIPVTAEVLRPAGATHGGVFEARAVATLLPGLRREFNALYVNGIATERRGDRLEARVRLGATPDPSFEIEAARREIQDLLADPALRTVAVTTCELPRLRLRFVDKLPGHGLRTYRIARGAARTPEPLIAEALPGGGGAIENASWRVEVDAQGQVALFAKRHAVRIDDALQLVSEGDRGDEYNFDPVPGEAPICTPTRVRVRALRRSGGEVALRITAAYRVPEALQADRDARSRRSVSLPVRLELRLLAGLDRIDLRLCVTNTSRDHRLRLHCRAPFRAERFEVESAFEVVERPIAPAPDSFGAARPSEFPIGAVPQRAFATLFGPAGLALTVANRGVAEVEALPGGAASSALAITVLRAVGWLSRSDLRLRPGPAGPELATPGAQVPGSHEIELSLRLHAAEDPRRAAEAHAFAFPALAFAAAPAAAGPLGDGARLVEIDDPGVVVSAIEPVPHGGVELRVVNLDPREKRVRVRWNGGGGSGLRVVDLAGRAVSTPGFGSDPGDPRAGHLQLGPWQIATLRAG
jgi:hypothetical protein